MGDEMAIREAEQMTEAIKTARREAEIDNMINKTSTPEAPGEAAPRNALDRIRDMLGDAGFVAFCRGTAMMLSVPPDGTPAMFQEEAERQAVRFARLCTHIESGGREPDPRVGEPGFIPYVRPAMTETRIDPRVVLLNAPPTVDRVDLEQMKRHPGFVVWVHADGGERRVGIVPTEALKTGVPYEVDCGKAFDDAYTTRIVATLRSSDIDGALNAFESEGSGAPVATESAPSITSLVKAAHKNSFDHGFWDDVERLDTSHIPEKIALMHSELSEALECYRDVNKTIHDSWLTEKGKPEGFITELADVVIRIFDTCGRHGLDLEGAILAKMKYNAGRPYKHGRRN